jgi:hypothetical protein
MLAAVEEAALALLLPQVVLEVLVVAGVLLEAMVQLVAVEPLIQAAVRRLDGVALAVQAVQALSFFATPAQFNISLVVQ